MQKSKNKVKKETDIFRKTYKYFKAGKGEISFFVSMYQLFLLFVLAGDYALIKVIILGCVLIVLNFLAGWYSVKKLDTTSPYVMPYTQDYIKKDVLELKALASFFEQMHNKGYIDSLPQDLIFEALPLREKWVDE